MTLNIKDVEIAGLPAVQVRNMLRRADHKFTRTLIENHFGTSAAKANKIVQALCADGYIQFLETKQVSVWPAYKNGKFRHVPTDYYGLTDKGEKLTQASAMGRIPRERAERIVAGLAERVDEVNGNPD